VSRTSELLLAHNCRSSSGSGGSISSDISSSCTVVATFLKATLKFYEVAID